MYNVCWNLPKQLKLSRDFRRYCFRELKTRTSSFPIAETSADPPDGKPTIPDPASTNGSRGTPGNCYRESKEENPTPSPVGGRNWETGNSSNEISPAYKHFLYGPRSLSSHDSMLKQVGQASYKEELWPPRDRPKPTIFPSYTGAKAGSLDWNCRGTSPPQTVWKYLWTDCRRTLT
jgi:hypothetical protein